MGYQLPFQVNRNNDHPCAEAVYGVSKGDAGVAEELVAQALAYFNLRGEDKVWVEKLEAQAKLGSEVDGGYFNEFVGALGAGISGQVIVELATDKGVKAEVFNAVALKLELEGQVHVYALNGAGGYAVRRYTILKGEFLFAEGERRHKAEVDKAAQFKVSHEPYVKARLPEGLDALKSIGIGKRLAVVDFVHRKVEPECDAEVVELVIVVGHIEQRTLCQRTRGEK